jgi:hypothetical protein
MAERWLTYQQAGEALDMTAEAVRHRARRLGWRTQPGNEGRTLVLLPEGEAVRQFARAPVHPPVQTAVHSNEASGLAEVLKGQLERERERADKAEARAGQAEAEREAARIAAARAEGEAMVLREQMKAERGRAELAQAATAARLQDAEASRDGARAELADWTAGGPLGRAWRALVYRRGRP